MGLIRSQYQIDYLRLLVRRCCRKCVACQQAKARQNSSRGLMWKLEIPASIWRSISMDWTNLPTIKDENGKKFNHVLTVTDRASKQVILINCWWKEKAPQVAEAFLRHVVRERWLPASIISDRFERKNICVKSIFERRRITGFGHQLPLTSQAIKGKQCSVLFARVDNTEQWYEPLSRLFSTEAECSWPQTTTKPSVVNTNGLCDADGIIFP